MLDNLEVKRLENLLFKYRKKLIIKRISFILLVLCVIVAGVVVALILPNDNSANEAKIASTNELRQKVQDLKQKAKIFNCLKQFQFEGKARRIRNDMISTFLFNKKRLLVFNSWRNLANSLLNITFFPSNP